MTRLGVVGAGTMGAGIAQVGLTSGFDVVLFDPIADALEPGRQRIETGIHRGLERALWTEEEADRSRSRLTLSSEIGTLAPCDLVIEAAPEQLAIKQHVFRDLDAVCSAEAMLASNTSSIPLTAIAAGTAHPERVVGLHFFNPVPLMRLVEVIAAEQTSEVTIKRATEVVEKLGKRSILAPDGPGFLVNRCGRPFYGESLRLLQEGVGDISQIDRICRIGGGFRMGPFELMDLVGIDVNFAVAESFFELSFGEPRWRPTALQARQVASGRLGRKTGRGWYEYGHGGHRPQDPSPPDSGGGDGRALSVLGANPLADHIRRLGTAAGFAVSDAKDASAVATFFTEPHASAAELSDAPCPIVSCAAHSLAARRIRGVVGFNLANVPGGGRVVEFTRTSATTAGDAALSSKIASALGAHPEWVSDSPGLILGRLLAQVVNEAAFAYGEGLGTAQDIDTGVSIGLNYPRGPLAWGSEMGWDTVVDTLNGVWNERHEERYRVAPALIAAAAGEPLGG
jgi:3-hydroxybutyryl-CoA dehydrogenase